MEDNSFGLGFYPLPARLSGLGRFCDNLAPKKLVEYLVFPREGVWILVAKSNFSLSIEQRDLKSLLASGLIRIQCNEPGTLAFYFQHDPIPVPTDRVAGDYDRR